ncbi:cupin domain-containing protein [Acidobacteria bacterium AB60]|nr:cupin domain-containing protein [Acidobacteria bacterium AB60]
MPSHADRVIDLSSESNTSAAYENHAVAGVNDHVIRISVMTEPYHWHCHPDSDETFLVLEGGLILEFEGESVELLPGHMLTVERGVCHRTRPLGERSVNLTFERADARTEALPAPLGP